MEKQLTPNSVLGKKRKRKISNNLTAEPKTIKVESPTKPIDVSPKKKNKNKKTKTAATEATSTAGQIVVTDTVESADTPKPKKQNAGVQKTQLPAVTHKGLSVDEIEAKYPILNNKELIDRFLKVTLNNNQKGRIRQAIKAQLQGSDNMVSAEILHGKIQAILKSSENLTDSDLRRIRILHNMLRTTLKPSNELVKTEKKKKVKKPKKEKKDDEESKKKPQLNKQKGPKRYVVFIGNLPLDVDKEKLMKHFADLDEHIKDVRIPQPAEGKKSAIAFMEFTNEPVYEMALSKHHSMLDNKRINVMYTAQDNGKVSKSEAKGKAAKLVALQKSGKLIGSTALNKKRSHRRNIMKKAKATEAAKENA